jgi:hypothetical protein
MHLHTHPKEPFPRAYLSSKSSIGIIMNILPLNAAGYKLPISLQITYQIEWYHIGVQMYEGSCDELAHFLVPLCAASTVVFDV